MKQITFTEKEIKEAAIDEMERCIANVQVNNRRMAMINVGVASVWEEIYTACTGMWLEDECDEHYLNMQKIYEKAERTWKAKSARREMFEYMCDCIEKYADEDAVYEWWECLPEETEEICKDADTYDKVCELFERLCPKVTKSCLEGRCEMIRSKLVKDLRRYTGAGVVTVEQLTLYLGFSDRKSVRKYTNGLQKFGKGYAIEDVADRIMEVDG